MYIYFFLRNESRDIQFFVYSMHYLHSELLSYFLLGVYVIKMYYIDLRFKFK